ncbi:MAG TPA: VCBS repeat-containing protein, partial [Chthonomonadaceae bacterium]|nr:VCBS repeat-containing protein [Chthonomonadaceae bacterium]
QTIGNGCAFLDYDNDGNLDILLVGPKLALYKGDGHGHFSDVTQATGLDKLSGHLLGCAVGDYDNDGYDDLYISGYRAGLLLHNEAGKSFRDVTREAGLKPQPWGTSCAFADFDGDGFLDLFIGNYARFDATSPQLCPQGGILTSCSPTKYAPLPGVLCHNLSGRRFEPDLLATFPRVRALPRPLSFPFAPGILTPLQLLPPFKILWVIRCALPEACPVCSAFSRGRACRAEVRSGQGSEADEPKRGE